MAPNTCPARRHAPSIGAPRSSRNTSQPNPPTSSGQRTVNQRHPPCRPSQPQTALRHHTPPLYSTLNLPDRASSFLNVDCRLGACNHNFNFNLKQSRPADENSAARRFKRDGGWEVRRADGGKLCRTSAGQGGCSCLKHALLLCTGCTRSDLLNAHALSPQ